jgi:glutamate--cysteine ligase
VNSGAPGILKEGAIGLEKESLRVTRDGTISQSPHPSALGSALTHPYITTDYSEALLELITPPLPDLQDTLQYLCDLHTFVYPHIGDELLWATSMPCILAGEENVPIARYGTSHAGRMKHIYRVGLGHRYGRVMQVIAGVHFNYSPPDAFWPVFQDQEGSALGAKEFLSHGYFCLIRNLQRFGWLIAYLFGASPAVCKSFFVGKQTRLPLFDEGTHYEPCGTSLRMSDIGYQNKQEHNAGLYVSYSNLEDYIASLTWAIETPHPDYEAFGVVEDGEYRQLNANVLQIENEYYSSTRPKQLVAPDEKPTLALRRRGVRYVELRSIDVSAFDPLGVNEDQLRFLEAFLVLCLLHDSPPIGSNETREIDLNQRLSAQRGRDPDLVLQRQGQGIRLRDWAGELCAAMEGVCDLLDWGGAARAYAGALQRQKEVVRDADRTPSARMLAEMRRHGDSFYSFAMRMSQKHREYFRLRSLGAEQRKFFTRLAQKSDERQREMEAADDCSFDEYLRRYFAQA